MPRISQLDDLEIFTKNTNPTTNNNSNSNSNNKIEEVMTIDLNNEKKEYHKKLLLKDNDLIDGKQRAKKLRNTIAAVAIKEYDERSNTDSYKSGNWCASFYSWVIKNSKYGDVSAADLLGDTSNSTGTLMKLFLDENNPNVEFYYNDRNPLYTNKNQNKLKAGEKNYTPQPGDAIFFDLNKSTSTTTAWNSKTATQDHTGIVKEVLKDDNGNVTGIITIEGNISIGGPSTFYERKIDFSNTNDKYAVGIIGYGSIVNVPQQETDNDSSKRRVFNPNSAADNK